MKRKGGALSPSKGGATAPSASSVSMGDVPRVPFACTFYPSEQEFSDPCAYISAIAPLAAITGIAKIVPPASWKPPSSVAAREESNQKYKTRLQSVHALSQGLPFPDGNLYTFSEYRAMADDFMKTNFPEFASSSTKHEVLATSDPTGGSGAKRRKLHPATTETTTNKPTEPERMGPYTIYPDGAVVGSDSDPRVKQEKEKQRAFRSMTNAKSGGENDQEEAFSLMSPVARQAKAVEAKYWEIVERGGCNATSYNESLEALGLSGAWGEGIPPPPPAFGRPQGSSSSSSSSAGESDLLRMVFVEYANDNDSKEVGSGFPRLGDRLWEKDLLPLIEEARKTKESTTTKEGKTLEDEGNSNDVESALDFLAATDTGAGAASIASLHDHPPPAVVNPTGRWEDPSYYLECPWNLNNLPFIKPSLLRHLQEEVNGVNIPWLYLGMLFSSFAWHNEDHHLFSINYMHHTTTPSSSGEGGGKTWYSVPGASTAEFERVLTDVILKANQEASDETLEAGFHGEETDAVDALFQITTMVSPAVLMKHGVPVYRLLQEPGEFVVTFPSAYHSGFSHGFNMAEACNFALPDWLPWGRAAVQKYLWAASVGSQRSLCFSHEQLLCNLARHVKDHAKHYYQLHHQQQQRLLASSSSSSSSMPAPLAAAQRALEVIAAELSHLIESEERQREGLLSPTNSGGGSAGGKGAAAQLHLTNESDPRHECLVCKQICYVSACVCRACASAPPAAGSAPAGTKRAVACLRHAPLLCDHDGSQKLVVYWYSLQDLRALLDNVRKEQTKVKGMMTTTAASDAGAGGAAKDGTTAAVGFMNGTTAASS
jgi:JmjC domain, hydroxylase/jmjN domain/C5HC2 zinc finger